MLSTTQSCILTSDNDFYSTCNSVYYRKIMTFSTVTDSDDFTIFVQNDYKE